MIKNTSTGCTEIPCGESGFAKSTCILSEYNCRVSSVRLFEAKGVERVSRKRDRTTGIAKPQLTHNSHPLYPEMFIRGMPTNEYKLRLIEDAERHGIRSGYYEGWEIVRMLNAIAAQRDALWQNELQEHSAHLLTMMELEARLVEIHSYVGRTPGKLFVIADDEFETKIYPFTDQDVGGIADVLAQFLMMSERIGLPAHEAPIIEIAQRTMQGLRCLLNGYDNGETLREASKEFSSIAPSIRRWIEEYRAPGGPSEATNQWIAQRADELLTEYRRGSRTDWQSLTKRILQETINPTAGDKERAKKLAVHRVITVCSTISEQANFVKITHWNNVGSKGSKRV